MIRYGQCSTAFPWCCTLIKFPRHYAHGVTVVELKLVAGDVNRMKSVTNGMLFKNLNK
jgi:hypothetical protein